MDDDQPDLGDLLALLHAGPDRVRRLRAEITRTADPEVTADLWARHVASGQGGVLYAYPDQDEGDGDDDAQYGATVERRRIWVDRDARLEREEGTESAESFAVRRGDTWWRWSAYGGAMTNGDEEIGTSIADDQRWILGGLGVVAALRLRAVTRSRVHGRETLRCRAVPRTSGDDDDQFWPFDHLPGHGATEYEIDVDREHGVILRVRGLFEGRELDVTEVVDLGVDETFADELFVFEVPDGSEVRSASELHGQHLRDLTPRDLAERAEFAVFVPARVPTGWETTLGFSEGSVRPPVRPSATMRLASPDGLRSVTVQQIEVDGAGEYDEWDHADPAPWSETVAGGVLYEWRDAAEDWQPARVRFDRAGTRVFLDSTSLQAQDLLALATAMVPLDVDGPDFTGSA